MGIKTSIAVWSLVGGVLAGCAQGHCRHKVDAPALPPASPQTGQADATSKSKPEHIFVYKYDGSLQCGKGKAIAPEVMAKELSGIQVFSSEKRSDGLMHIQVCGSITGKTNVFEIPASSLKQAESRGFKVWAFE